MQIELENDSKKSGISKKRVANLRGNSLIISPQLFDYIKEFNLPVSPVTEQEKASAALKFRLKVANSLDLYLAEVLKSEVLKPLKTPGHYILAGEGGDRVIPESLLYSTGLSIPEEFRAASKLAYKLNAILRSFFERRGCDLISVSAGFVSMEDKIVINGGFRYSDIMVSHPGQSRRIKDYLIYGKPEDAGNYIKFLNKILD